METYSDFLKIDNMPSSSTLSLRSTSSSSSVPLQGYIFCHWKRYCIDKIVNVIVSPLNVTPCVTQIVNVKINNYCPKFNFNFLFNLYLFYILIF